MSIDDRIRAALGELAPEVPTDAVMAALEARLAAGPPPPAPPRPPAWRRWLGGGAALGVLVVAVILGVLADGGGGDEGARPQLRPTIDAGSASPGSTAPGGAGTAPGSSSVPEGSTSSTVAPGAIPAPGVPGGAPVPTVPQAPAPPSTTTTGIDSTTTTSVPAPTTTVPPTTTTTSPPTTTTTAPNDGPPVLVGAALGADEVWELDPVACPRASTVGVSVQATDDLGIASVVATMSGFGGKPVALALVAAEGRYRAELGPWPVGTVPFGLSLPVSVTLTATDTAGQEATVVVGSFLVRSVSTC